MKNLLIASVALLGLAGAAVAQEVPDFYGQNPYAGTVDATHGVSHSARVVSPDADTTVSVPAQNFNANLNQNYSGK